MPWQAWALVIMYAFAVLFNIGLIWTGSTLEPSSMSEEQEAILRIIIKVVMMLLVITMF